MVLEEGWLILQCVTCGAHGTIDAPTEKEWSEAFHAPSRPYRWTDAARVTVRHRDCVSPYVVARQAGANCGPDCPRRQEVGDYERVPAEIIRPFRRLSDAEHRGAGGNWRLSSRAATCACSLFALFVEGYQADTGHESSDAVRHIARRIDAISRKGLHFRPAIVAHVLREFARVNS